MLFRDCATVQSAHRCTLVSCRFDKPRGVSVRTPVRLMMGEEPDPLSGINHVLVERDHPGHPHWPYQPPDPSLISWQLLATRARLEAPRKTQQASLRLPRQNSRPDSPSPSFHCFRSRDFRAPRMDVIRVGSIRCALVSLVPKETALPQINSGSCQIGPLRNNILRVFVVSERSSPAGHICHIMPSSQSQVDDPIRPVAGGDMVGPDHQIRRTPDALGCLWR